MLKGTIKRLMNRGFGFIQTEDKTDLFFHSTALEGVEFDSLSEGQEVEFEQDQGQDGRPRANKVRLTETQASDDGGDDQGGDDQGGDDQDEGEDEVQAQNHSRPRVYYSQSKISEYSYKLSSSLIALVYQPIHR